MTDDRQLPIQPDPGPAVDGEPGSSPVEPPTARRATPPLPPPTERRTSSADVRPHRPEYRGEELDPERGPGLGCFWFQMIVLGFFIVIIPIGLNLNWPFEVLAILLFVVIGLLLLTGQTVIFLLRLVAADRRSAGRRRPLASSTKTVGEIEEEIGAEPAPAPVAPAPVATEPAATEPAATTEPAFATTKAAEPAPVQPVDSESMIPAQRPGEAGAGPGVGPITTEAIDGSSAAERSASVTDHAATESTTEPALATSAVEAANGHERPAAGSPDAPSPRPMQESSTDGRRTDPADGPAPAAEPESSGPEEPDPGVRQ